MNKVGGPRVGGRESKREGGEASGREEKRERGRTMQGGRDDGEFDKVITPENINPENVNLTWRQLQQEHQHQARR